jgi:hypothetical protein
MTIQKVGYSGKRVDVVFTATGTYSQYDVVGALTEVPSWAGMNGGPSTIRDMRITVNNNAITPQFEVHFFKAANPTVAADNVAWTELFADYTKRAGYIQMPICAKATGTGTIDFVRAQHLDAEYGVALGREIACATGLTSIWVALKLISTATTFASGAGNSVVLTMLLEQG